MAEREKDDLTTAAQSLQGVAHVATPAQKRGWAAGQNQALNGVSLDGTVASPFEPPRRKACLIFSFVTSQIIMLTTMVCRYCTREVAAGPSLMCLYSHLQGGPETAVLSRLLAPAKSTPTSASRNLPL